MLTPMFGLAVRLAIGITCTLLYFSEALGPGLPNYVLTFAMIMSAAWKWAFRLVRLITGTSARLSRNIPADAVEPGISDHLEERIRQAARQFNGLASEQFSTNSVNPPNVPSPATFGKRR